MARMLLQREKKQEIDGRERTLVKQQIYFVADATKDFHTKYGIISKEDLAKPDGTTITNNKGLQLVVYTAQFSDKLSRIRKIPQSIIRKDAGRILAEIGLGKDSIAIDAGVGNGFLTIMLSRICKQVIGYEVDKRHLANAKENIEKLEITNITLKNASVYEPIDEKNVDAFILDVPEPWQALKTTHSALAFGGHLVTYSPSIVQVKKTVEEAQKNTGWLFVKTIELIERPWKVYKEAVRPANIEIGHTAFLTFFRKIS
jgi:tRNA (adenine57-N1/adenine58-N1)-methyltransferase